MDSQYNSTETGYKSHIYGFSDFNDITPKALPADTLKSAHQKLSMINTQIAMMSLTIASMQTQIQQMNEKHSTDIIDLQARMDPYEEQYGINTQNASPVNPESLDFTKKSFDEDDEDSAYESDVKPRNMRRVIPVAHKDSPSSYVVISAPEKADRFSDSESDDDINTSLASIDTDYFMNMEPEEIELESV